MNNLTKCNALNISCVGDIALIGEVYDQIIKAESTKIRSNFIKQFINSDIVLCNLEAPITTRESLRSNKAYNFKAGVEALSLFDERFIFSLANNHILDFGEEGLEDTIIALKERGFKFAGAGSNIDQARKAAILERKGKKLAVLCAADPRFQAATKNSAGTFPALPLAIKEAIQDIKSSVDYVAVSIHGGMEFVSTPSKRQFELVSACIEGGAHIVHFHHTHCLSGFIKDTQSVVLYGTGNFLFPDIMKIRFPGAKQSAIWHTAWTDNECKNVTCVPYVINDCGFPEVAQGYEKKQILSKIDFYSRQITNGRYIAALRILELMRPAFLRLALSHYLDIIKRKGLIEFFKTLIRGLKMQLGRS